MRGITQPSLHLLSEYKLSPFIWVQIVISEAHRAGMDAGEVLIRGCFPSLVITRRQGRDLLLFAQVIIDCCARKRRMGSWQVANERTESRGWKQRSSRGRLLKSCMNKQKDGNIWRMAGIGGRILSYGLHLPPSMSYYLDVMIRAMTAKPYVG